MEKKPPKVSLSGYPNIAIIYSGFLASQRCIESDFYVHDSPNDNLESKI